MTSGRTSHLGEATGVMACIAHRSDIVDAFDVVQSFDQGDFGHHRFAYSDYPPTPDIDTMAPRRLLPAGPVPGIS